MSFLASLVEKKGALRPTQTTITYPNGKCYIENRTSTLPIETDKKIYGYVVDNKPDEKPAKILDYIYLGSQDSCAEEVLEKYRISNVLSVGIEPPQVSLGISYHFLECLDLPETNIWKIVESSVEVIKSSVNHCENILVHCNAGVSRSPSVVIGYLILEHHYDYTKAFEHVKSLRPSIKPNDGFQQQLKEYNLHI